VGAPGAYQSKGFSLHLRLPPPLPVIPDGQRGTPPADYTEGALESMPPVDGPLSAVASEAVGHGGGWGFFLGLPASIGGPAVDARALPVV
jgi:hypothetical protein